MAKKQPKEKTRIFREKRNKDGTEQLELVSTTTGLVSADTNPPTLPEPGVVTTPTVVPTVLP